MAGAIMTPPITIAPPPRMRTWNVRVHRFGVSEHLGTVHETTEANARCAALSTFGQREGKAYTEKPGFGPLAITDTDDFDVSPTDGRPY